MKLFLIGLVASATLVQSKLIWDNSIPYVEKQILVTGYGAFHNFAINPSQLVAEQLNGTCMVEEITKLKICWEGWSVAVDETSIKEIEKRVYERRIQWDAIIHLGLEDSSKGLKLETVAVNVLASEQNAGSNLNIPCKKTGTIYHNIKEDGECILPTTAPLNRLNLPHALTEPLGDGFEAWSRDAGAYYCNEIYYRSLYAMRHHELYSLIPVLFVHLPDRNTIPVDHDIKILQFIGSILVS